VKQQRIAQNATYTS